MKTRKDQLIEFAFGELSDTEKQSLSLTASEKKELEGLASLCADLRALRDVPECQISTERMRDAVLKAEIRQRRDWRRWLPLTAVPAAAALALLALNFVKPPAVTQPTNIAATERPISSPLVATRVEDNGMSFDASDAAAFMLNAAAVVESLATNEQPVAPVVNRSSKPRPRNRVRMTTARNQPVVRAVAKTQPAADTAAPVRSIPAPTNQPEPIVMISNEQDNNTGARRANEVETSHDVVIGG